MIQHSLLAVPKDTIYTYMYTSKTQETIIAISCPQRPKVLTLFIPLVTRGLAAYASSVSFGNPEHCFLTEFDDDDFS